MILFKNADVYAPKYLGKKDVLVEGSKIKKIADNIETSLDDELIQTINMEDKVLIPGFIDQHVHIIGGGGEGGPGTRVPESNISGFISCGVTTVLGLLGTDGVSRSLENLYAKAKSLNEDGITCYMETGSYAYPPTTLTGSVERDIYLIDLCIGVKIAVSDHRRNPDQQYFPPKGSEEFDLSGNVPDQCDGCFPPAGLHRTAGFEYVLCPLHRVSASAGNDLAEEPLVGRLAHAYL